MVGLGIGYSRGGNAWFENFSTIESSTGSATVTANSTAHTKGSWVQIIASNSEETSAVLLVVSGVSTAATDTATLVDIGVGSSGSETVIAENIAIGGNANVAQLIPLRVPSGSRIAARIQSKVSGGKTATVALRTHQVGNIGSVPFSVDVLGTSTVTSEGTPLTTSYTEVVASTSKDYRAICIVESLSTTTASNAAIDITVGVGVSGSEVEICKKIVGTNTSEQIISFAQALPVSGVYVPAGSRLAAKTSTSACDVTIIGVP